MEATRWREADRILGLALDLDEHEIGALLAAECGDDLELRATVESLLEHDRGDLEILDRPPFLSSPATAPGERVGPWHLGSLIGEGGSGAVYEAERLDGPFEGPVAIKLLHQHLCTSRARDRFYFESQVLARLDHPHIARLYDTGVSEQGVPYMVLERVEGTRLDRWIREARPSLDDRLQLFEEICQAVAFAHRNLVVHRDLKPGNVLVTAAGQPKLLDFGIARVLPGPGEDLSRLTRTHQQPMTPQYASPEQLRGQDVTTASDVYSLGLVLYELLTSRLPYQMESLLGEEIHLLLNGDLLIQKPSLRARREAPGSLFPSEIRPDLDTIVLTALETDLERRYPTAQALAEEIARFRSGRPIRARSPSAGYLLRRFVDRNRLATVAGSLFFLLVAGCTAELIGTTQRLRDQERRARAEAATAQETVEFLGGLFEGAEPAVHQGRELTARQLLDRGASALGDREDQDPETRAALATAIGKAYLEISRFPEARSFLEEALDLRRRASVPSPEKTAEVRLLLARLERRESHSVARPCPR